MRPLPRTLGVFDLTLLVVGTVIGSGIFLVPGGVLRQAGGRVALALAIWVVGGVLSLLAGLSLFYYRRQRPDLPRPFKVPGYPWAPSLFVLSAVGIVVTTLITQPGRALVGVAVVLAGLPAFWLWRRNSISGGRP